MDVAEEAAAEAVAAAEEAPVKAAFMKPKRTHPARQAHSPRMTSTREKSS